MREPFEGEEGKRRLVAVFAEQDLVGNNLALAQKLAETAKVDECEEGQELYRQGEQSKGYLYFVLSGAFDLLDRSNRIATISSGQVVGEFPILDPSVNYAVTCRAQADSTVGLVTEDQLQLIGEEYPELWKNMAKILAGRLRGRMNRFTTKRLPVQRDAIAPDGSDVRVLLALQGGSMAHFELAPGGISIAVAHRTVEEIWFFVSGRGEMWRKLSDYEEVVPVDPGVCLTIPHGTHFQFRSFGHEPLAAMGITMPPWPGEGEVYNVPGKWAP